MRLTTEQFKDWLWQPCIHDYVGVPKHWTRRKRDCDKCIDLMLNGHVEVFTELAKLMRSSTHPLSEVREQLGYAANLLEDSIFYEPLPQFCLQCGAGRGKFRRDGEGTCPECDETIPADKI